MHEDASAITRDRGPLSAFGPGHRSAAARERAHSGPYSTGGDRAPANRDYPDNALRFRVNTPISSTPELENRASGRDTARAVSPGWGVLCVESRATPTNSTAPH